MRTTLGFRDGAGSHPAVTTARAHATAIRITIRHGARLLELSGSLCTLSVGPGKPNVYHEDDVTVSMVPRPSAVQRLKSTRRTPPCGKTTFERSAIRAATVSSVSVPRFRKSGAAERRDCR